MGLYAKGETTIEQRYTTITLFRTYSLPWRMHRYYTRNRDSKPSRKVHSVSATECYWLSAQLQTIVQRFCTWQRRYGKVSRFKSFAKPSFSSRGGNISRFRLLFAFICAKTFLSLNRVSIERGINTRNLYIEHFRILISVAINPF